MKTLDKLKEHLEKTELSELMNQVYSPSGGKSETLRAIEFLCGEIDRLKSANPSPPVMKEEGR